MQVVDSRLIHIHTLYIYSILLTDKLSLVSKFGPSNVTSSAHLMHRLPKITSGPYFGARVHVSTYGQYMNASTVKGLDFVYDYG